ncbi:hypothetical protein Tco_1218247 [Tanacetum coccineum]
MEDDATIDLIWFDLLDLLLCFLEFLSNEKEEAVWGGLNRGEDGIWKNGVEVDINKKTENQAKMTKYEHGMEKTLWLKIKAKSKNAKVRVPKQKNQHVKPEPEAENNFGSNLNPSDGPGNVT